MGIRPDRLKNALLFAFEKIERVIFNVAINIYCDFMKEQSMLYSYLQKLFSGKKKLP